MKKVLLVFIAMMTMTVAMAQQVTHVIQRGETLESIAQKYQVTVDAIKQANPETAEMTYIGMRIIIPVKPQQNADADKRNPNEGQQSSVSIQTQSQVAVQKETSHEQMPIASTDIEGGTKLNTWRYSGRIGYNLFKIKDAEYFSYSMVFTLGSHYYFAENAYLAAYLGYYGATLDYSYKVDRKTAKLAVESHNIILPIGIGVNVPISDNVNFLGETGPSFVHALFGKIKTDAGSTSFSDNDDIERFGSFYTISAGIAIKNWDVNCMISYSFPLSSKSANVAKDTNFFGISLVFEK